MALIDFSETKRQWNELRRGAIRTRLESINEKLGGGLGRFLAPLLEKLPKNESIRWTIFAGVSVFSTFMLLHFIDSFLEEQDRYETVLTSVGRNRVEYNALGREGTTTVEERKEQQGTI